MKEKADLTASAEQQQISAERQKLLTESLQETRILLEIAARYRAQTGARITIGEKTN